MVYHGLSWFSMVYHGLSWFIMLPLKNCHEIISGDCMTTVQLTLGRSISAVLPQDLRQRQLSAVQQTWDFTLWKLAMEEWKQRSVMYPTIMRVSRETQRDPHAIWNCCFQPSETIWWFSSVGTLTPKMWKNNTDSKTPTSNDVFRSYLQYNKWTTSRAEPTHHGPVCHRMAIHTFFGVGKDVGW